MNEDLKKVEETFIKCGELVLRSILIWTVGIDGFKEKLEKTGFCTPKWYKDAFLPGQHMMLNGSFDIEKFDIALLFRLILYLSGIEDPEIYKWKQSTTFAKSIWEIKELRNRMTHKALSKDEEEMSIKEWHQKLKDWFIEVLTEVGRFKSIGQDIVDKQIYECTKELNCLQEIRREASSHQNDRVHNRSRDLTRIKVEDDTQLNEFLQKMKNPHFDCSYHNLMLRFSVKPNISNLEEAIDLFGNYEHTEIGLWLDYEYYNKISEECSDSLIQKLSSVCNLIAFRGRVTDFALLPSTLRQLLVNVKPEEISDLDTMVSRRSLWNLVINIECSPGQVFTPPTLLYSYNHKRKNQLGVRLSSELNDGQVQWAVDIVTKLCPSTRDRHPKKWATSLGFWGTRLTATGIEKLIRLLSNANFRAPENRRSANVSTEEFLQIRTYERIFPNEKKRLNKLVKDFDLRDLKISCIRTTESYSAPSASGGCEELD